MWSLIVVLLDEASDATRTLDEISIPFHPDLFFLQSAMERLYQADTGRGTIADSYVLEMAALQGLSLNTAWPIFDALIEGPSQRSPQPRETTMVTAIDSPPYCERIELVA